MTELVSMRKIPVEMYILLAFLVLASTAFATAQTASEPPGAPIPRSILNAKTVFIANAGADAGLFPHPFSGTPDRAYNQFYADLRSAGSYKLVDDPSQADLVLELRLTAPYGPSNADKQKGASDPLPMFRLAIYHDHYLLWAITEPIEAANLQKTHDRNFDDALRTLVSDFRTLSAKDPPQPTP